MDVDGDRIITSHTAVAQHEDAHLLLLLCSGHRTGPCPPSIATTILILDACMSCPPSTVAYSVQSVAIEEIYMHTALGLGSGDLAIRMGAFIIIKRQS